MKNNFHKKDRKAFTIVELVIVIAVIAILAAVLIPTFANIIKRSQISSDTQLCRNLNTVLTMAVSEGRVPGSMYDVLYLINEAGYRLENLNPTAEGYYFAWDSEGQKMIYIKEDLNTIIYPEDYKVDKSKCWITVGDAEELKRVADEGYNVYLEKSIDEDIVLHNVAPSIDTGEFRLKSLTIDGTAVNPSTSILRGNFGETKLDIGNASYSNSGSISSLTVGSNTVAMAINGNVGSVASSISNTTVSSTGAIGAITVGSVTNSTGTTFTSTSGSVSGAVNGVVNVGSKEDIENVRVQIANGRTFENETITLPNDINMAGIAFQPISNYSRSDNDLSKAATTYFQGDFDGQNHTIQNFSTSGFSINGLNAGKNNTTPTFNGKSYNEAVYGLFGAVYAPEGKTITIKNVKVDVDISMILDNANELVGDSVGGIVGFAYGKGTLRFENCTVTGKIEAYDGVGGLLGRTKCSKVEFVDCTNSAQVTGVRKTGAFVGTSYTNGSYQVTYSGCKNYGKIECLGRNYDDATLGCSKLGGDDGKMGGYYFVSQSSPEQGWSNVGIEYLGTTFLAGVEVTEVTDVASHVTSGVNINPAK